LLKTIAQQASIVIGLMLRLFGSKIESNLRVGSTICDYAWLHRVTRSAFSEQGGLSAYR
jgi:hypothetical protein